MMVLYRKPFTLLKMLLFHSYIHIRSNKYEHLHQNLIHSVQFESHWIWNDPCVIFCVTCTSLLLAVPCFSHCVLHTKNGRTYMYVHKQRLQVHKDCTYPIMYCVLFKIHLHHVTNAYIISHRYYHISVHTVSL